MNEGIGCPLGSSSVHHFNWVDYRHILKIKRGKMYHEITVLEVTKRMENDAK